VNGSPVVALSEFEAAWVAEECDRLWDDWMRLGGGEASLNALIKTVFWSCPMLAAQVRATMRIHYDVEPSVKFIKAMVAEVNRVYRAVEKTCRGSGTRR
jgi:hypothetical protein